MAGTWQEKLQDLQELQAREGERAQGVSLTRDDWSDIEVLLLEYDRNHGKEHVGRYFFGNDTAIVDRLSALLLRDRMSRLTGARPASMPATSIGTCLADLLRSKFQLNGPAFEVRQRRVMPSIAVTDETVSELGSYFHLEAYDNLAMQMLSALVRLNKEFMKFKKPGDEALFRQTVQLLRLVSAPGMGKSTALKEVWQRVSDIALNTERDQLCKKPDSAHLLQRIETSLSTNRMMVFYLDLSLEGLNVERADDGWLSMLALRMLYASVRESNTWPDYQSFVSALAAHEPALKRTLTARAVLQFWQTTAGISEGTPWLAVLAIDEANAVPSDSSSSKATWLQNMISEFVSLRAAVRQEADGLCCMPVIVTASTCASASSLAATASRKSSVRDLRLPALTLQQMTDIVKDIVQRLPGMAVPTSNGLLAISNILEWLGGNPRLLSYALCALSGSAFVMREEVLLVGPSAGAWLDGTFNKVEVVNSLALQVAAHSKWDSWLSGDKSELLSALVAHSVLQVQVRRGHTVCKGWKVTWQELENDGLWYVGAYAEANADPASNVSLDIDSSPEKSSAPQQAACVESPDPDSTVGLLINIPPLLLVAAATAMRVKTTTLPFVSLLVQQSVDWWSQEISDCQRMVVKLFLFRHVMGRETVLLGELLGRVKVSKEANVTIMVPDRGYVVHRAERQLNPDLLQQQIERVNQHGAWAFVGTGNDPAPDSWLILRRPVEGNVGAEHSVFVLYIQSKQRQTPRAIRLDEVQHEWKECCLLPASQTGNTRMLLITDHTMPQQVVSAELPPEVQVIPHELHDEFYSHCISFIKHSLVEPVAQTPSEKRRRHNKG
eukprot:jgi/Chlat1/3170/Chrsp22S00248